MMREIRGKIMEFDFGNVYFHEKTGEIATPMKFISKKEALKMFPNRPERLKRLDTRNSKATVRSSDESGRDQQK